MSPKVRNLAVGVTVLAALGTLGWMIFKFGAAPAAFFKPPQYHITFTADRGDGLGDGSNITYKGIAVGRVTKVFRDARDDRIVIQAIVDQQPPMPANLIGDIIFTSPLGGVSSLNLSTDGPAQGQLGENAALKARFLGSTFLPPEFSILARSINETVVRLNQEDLIGSLRKTVDATRERIEAAGKVIEGMDKLVNDPAMRDQLKASLANLQKTTEDASAITSQIRTTSAKFDSLADNADKTLTTARGTLETSTKRIDEIGANAGEQLVRLGKVLDNLQSITAKIDKGDGTAGALVNDPKLYQSLIDTTREANGLMSDMRRLVQQWEQEGIPLKFGK